MKCLLATLSTFELRPLTSAEISFSRSRHLHVSVPLVYTGRRLVVYRALGTKTMAPSHSIHRIKCLSLGLQHMELTKVFPDIIVIHFLWVLLRAAGCQTRVSDLAGRGWVDNWDWAEISSFLKKECSGCDQGVTEGRIGSSINSSVTEWWGSLAYRS